MIKREIFIGFAVGVIANCIGLWLSILIFGNGNGIEASIKESLAQGFFGKLVSIGAILNLVVFFLFLKKKQDYRARGVILATLVVAILSFLIKFT